MPISQIERARRSDDPRYPFVVLNDKAFAALPHWMRRRGALAYEVQDAGRINVLAGREPKGFILIHDDDLFEPTIKALDRFIAKESERAD